MPSNQMATQLISRNTIALKKILDSGNDDGVEAVKKVIDLYQSCLNTSAIESAGVQPMLDLINMSGMCINIVKHLLLVLREVLRFICM